MIGLLIGKPLVSTTGLIVLCNGVGYQVQVGAKTLAAAAQQPEVTLFIYTHVREESLDLYGFRTEEEKRLFLLLLAVSGVGPKTALGIADEGAEKISAAVQNAEVSFFTKLPRVGKKLAQKIIIELKSKLGGLKELELGGFDEKTQALLDAVTSLGFEETVVIDRIRELDMSTLTESQAVSQILKQLAKS